MDNIRELMSLHYKTFMWAKNPSAFFKDSQQNNNRKKCLHAFVVEYIIFTEQTGKHHDETCAQINVNRFNV